MKMSPQTFQKILKTTPITLAFSDGTEFQGFTQWENNDPRLEEGIWGEAAFTTGMSGYVETMTDPSFLGQHIIFSSSHIGNYRSLREEWQSDKTHATSIIARHFSPNDFLIDIIEKKETPLISGLDTRALVQYLVQSKNSHLMVIKKQGIKIPSSQFTTDRLHVNELKRVSRLKPEVIIPGDNPIVLIDYGVKQAIVDQIKTYKRPFVIVPHHTSAKEVQAYQPQLIFLSNGPGDPREHRFEIEQVKELLKLNIPIRAICLGHQLIGLALGISIIRLPFGQRGINHPLLDHTNGEILISSQNHGYAFDEKSFEERKLQNELDRPLIVQYRSLFDQSIEGICSNDHFLKSVQFHPEANPGPSDAAIFFHEIEQYLKALDKGSSLPLVEQTPKVAMVDLHQQIDKTVPYKHVLLIGSGPIKIGQASEFDYSGTQACKALKEIGVDVILLNSNPATIMTDAQMATQTYIEPITKDVIKKIILKEKVDAVLSTMGGQTALNICIELAEDGTLDECGVVLLGANVDTIKKTEDRELFAKEMDKLGYQTGKRYQAASLEHASTLARDSVGYPLIIRRDFALGGKGAALVYNDQELKEVLMADVKFPVTLEKSLVGFKEIELEVMVDQERNGVIICSIENVDPCGVHTGDSITVAPAQTISDRCFQQLRTMTLTIAKHMGVVAGGANVQFAINPDDEDEIIVIEMNPRVSRSSALASKATGYPIAKISALLSVGYTLREILNDITKASPVAFEPTLDYVAIKIPVFPFNKFPTSSRVLGPQMRSVGEVLALGGSFNEAFQKALRAVEMGLEIPSLTQLKTTPLTIDRSYLQERLGSPQEFSLLACLEALRVGMSVEEIYQITKITPWFLEQIQEIKEFEDRLKLDCDSIKTIEVLRLAKGLGFSDKALAVMTNHSQKDILELRIQSNVFPVFKAVDTCSGEFLAETPYFYSTYHGDKCEAKPLSIDQRSVVILGSGPNRIGQGIEFDYSCVKACQHLKEKSIKAVMINSNPETVSTDYDSSDRLYLAPLYSEDVFDILRHENPEGIIASFAGQTGIQLREHIEKSFRSDFCQFKFLGPTHEVLELTEDRKLFDELTKKVDLSRTQSMVVSGHKNLLNAMIEIGLPVIIRPSYVIGGESMYIFSSFDDIHELPEPLKDQLKNASTLFQVENYLEEAIEYDVDLVRDYQGNCVFTVCEHIEYAGVHSGDSGMIAPPVVLTNRLYQKLKKISIDLANELNIIGPINFQYAIKDAKIYCIEANPRGSRTLPFLSKAYNISLPSLATDAMLGELIQPWDQETSLHYSVKQSTFPFDRFLQDNIILGPKMRSTGETMGIDYDKDRAIIKSYLGNYPKIDHVGKILISVSDLHKEIILPYLKHFHRMGYELMATSGTCQFIQKQGLPCTFVAKINEAGVTIVEALKDEKIVMVFNTPMNQGYSKSDGEIIRNTAIQYGIPCFTRPENIKAVMQSLIGSGLLETGLTPISLQELHQGTDRGRRPW
jgi:carbamoyl-phosphate synthase large subunit